MSTTTIIPDPLAEYYGKKENCYIDLGIARQTFGNKNTTEDEYEQMEKGLGLMYLYCPEDLQVIVEATLQESTIRKFYFNFT